MEPEAIGALVGIGTDVRRSMIEDRPGHIYRRVRTEILAACPQYAASWALEMVAGLVAEGVVPEIDVVKALDRFTRQVALGRRGEARPVRDPPSYLSTCLGDVLRRHGLVWSKTSGQTERKRA